MSLEHRLHALQSKHQQILKMPRHEQESRTVHRPIEAAGSADVTR